MITEIEKELREWLRPMSPLTAFAKSIRNEGAAVDPNAPKSLSDMFDADWDELPTNLKEKLGGIKTKITELETSAKTTEQRRLQAEDFARKQQSDASKAKARLAAHNIPLDGAQSVAVSGDAKFQARVDKFVKEGMAEPQAKAYAKMLDDEAKTQREEILKEIGPMAAQVGHLQATSALLEARSKFPEVFAIPALDKEITDAANYMLSQGNVPDANAIKSLVQMSWGKAIMDDPTLLKEKKGADLNQHDTIPRMSRTINTGGRQQQSDSVTDPKAPVATQPETSQIMGNLVAELRRGLPEKKGGK